MPRGLTHMTAGVTPIDKPVFFFGGCPFPSSFFFSVLALSSTTSLYTNEALQRNNFLPITLSATVGAERGGGKDSSQGLLTTTLFFNRGNLSSCWLVRTKEELLQFRWEWGTEFLSAVNPSSSSSLLLLCKADPLLSKFHEQARRKARLFESRECRENVRGREGGWFNI